MISEEEEKEFKQGDQLARAGDRVALEYGWWACEWLEIQRKKSGADKSPRAAFSYALDTLSKRHAQHLSSGQVTDRIRIAGAFPPDKHKDLSDEMHHDFSFSELRAAYVRDDETATIQNLLWGVENCATPAQIYAHKMGKQEVPADELAWANVIKWCQRFLDARFDNGENERSRLARAALKLERKKV